MTQFTAHEARWFKTDTPQPATLPEFDMAPGVISHYLAYDTHRRREWTQRTGLDENLSYRVWGDDDLKAEWERYVKMRVLQGGHIYRELISCLIYDDRQHIADWILSRAQESQLHLSKKYYPPANNPYLGLDGISLPIPL